MGAFASLKALSSLLSRRRVRQKGSAGKPFASRSQKRRASSDAPGISTANRASIEGNRAEPRELAAPHILSSFAKPVYPHSDPVFRILAATAVERPPPPQVRRSIGRSYDVR